MIKQDFRESRMGRPLVDVYSQQEEHGNRELISAVEKCMKKYADNLLRFLEGISGRLSQLELYCYNLERSIGELRSDLGRDQNESDLKLKSLEKHVQEVHRSVQILRDKQELAETQKELAKLQLAQKESSEGAAPAAAEPRKHVDSQDSSNQQLALVPQQATPAHPPVRVEQSLPYKELPLHQAAPSSVGLQQDPYVQTQGGGFYVPRSQLVNQMQPQQHPQTATLQTEQQYVAQRPQPQDLSRQPQSQQPVATQQVQHQPLPQYEQPWGQQVPQQFSQQVIQPQHVPPRAQMRPETSPAFSPYQSNQPGSALPDIYPSSTPMQATYAPVLQPGVNRQPAEPFNYGGPGSTVQLPPAPPSLQRQQVPPPTQSSFAPQVNKTGYPGTIPYPQQQSNVQGYATHGGDAGRPVQPPHFLPGTYPPAGIPSGQSQQPPNVHPGMQMMRSHPYAELVEKAISMGYVRDHVVSVIRRLEDSGQPVDFNSVLDMLNARPAGPSQRGWSG
ncbi:hypothetical protein Taro_027226 [Colocasia esculenta]|uniref:DUF1421 domain-containing protein n=1 Tax=Colocasia esculenta TaxID=4460 RepID=A0A843VHH5_COLES|nr:hypothetical protein [Colocasia esculenta]